MTNKLIKQVNYDQCNIQTNVVCKHYQYQLSTKNTDIALTSTDIRKGNTTTKWFTVKKGRLTSSI